MQVINFTGQKEKCEPFLVCDAYVCKVKSNYDLIDECLEFWQLKSSTIRVVQW